MITEEVLEKELKDGKLNSIYLFYGKEEYLIENSIKKIKKNFGSIQEGINYIKIDDTNISKIISEIETPSFGFKKKLIIAKDSGILKKEGKKKNAQNIELADKLCKYIKEHIEEINESIVLVIIEEEIEKNNLYKIIEKEGQVCEFKELKLIQIVSRIKAICNAYKVQIDDADIKYFVENVGTNMQNLINEIRKLIEYAGEGGTIHKKEIDLLCIKQLESVIFDLTDSLGNKNVQKALEVLNNLIYQKEPVQKILITLYNHFKKLYIVKMSEKYNKNIAECLQLKANQMFLVNKYKSQAKYFKEEEIRRIIGQLIDLDYNYKIGNVDINIGLESILCCCS